MRTNLRVIALVATALLLSPSMLAAQLYKWVDEKGVVNYSDRPPPRGKSGQTLAESEGTLSVVPGMSKDDLQSERERANQLRLQRLERELDDLRAREYARANAPPEPPIYQEVYVPAYGGYGWRPPHRPGSGGPGSHPKPPAAQPKSPFRPPPEQPAYTRR